MADSPRDRGGAARDEPGTRTRLVPRACLHSAKYCRALWAVLGTLLGAISLLPAGGRDVPAASLCATRSPDNEPTASCPFLLVLL